jgi:ketosteroid isomerase-like protein
MGAVEDVKKTAAELVGHFGASRVREYFECFSESADFIFYTHSERLTSRKAYEDLWKTWETEMNFKVLSCESTGQNIRIVANSIAIFTHNVSTKISTNDGTDTVLERETIIFELIDGRWIAIHEHLSPAAS